MPTVVLKHVSTFLSTATSPEFHGGRDERGQQASLVSSFSLVTEKLTASKTFHDKNGQKEQMLKVSFLFPPLRLFKYVSNTADAICLSRITTAYFREDVFLLALF